MIPQALFDLGISRDARDIYIDLRRRSSGNVDHICWPSAPVLMAAIGICRAHLFAAFKELEALVPPLMAREIDRQGRASNVYRVFEVVQHTNEVVRQVNGGSSAHERGPFSIRTQSIYKSNNQEIDKGARGTDGEYTPEFEAWWTGYPYLRGTKKGTFRQYQLRLKDGFTHEQLLSARNHLVKAGKDPQFVMHGERFLGHDLPFEQWIDGIPPGEMSEAEDDAEDPWQ